MTLRSEIIRLAATLPVGNPTRRDLLQAAQGRNADDEATQEAMLFLRDLGTIYQKLIDLRGHISGMKRDGSGWDEVVLNNFPVLADAKTRQPILQTISRVRKGLNVKPYRSYNPARSQWPEKDAMYDARAVARACAELKGLERSLERKIPHINWTLPRNLNVVEKAAEGMFREFKSGF